MKPFRLVMSVTLLCAIAQVNAGMMQYNTSNQLIRSDKQTMSYSPKGYLASVDDVHIIHGDGGSFIEQKGAMTSTVFGGVRMLSNGVSQSIFADNHNTLKTASSDKVQHSYTDPYGNAVATPKIKGESYPLERNRMTYDGGYQINDDLINFNARNYMSSIKRFTSNDSYDVPNRYNFSDGNPVMKFDPSGHNAKSVLNIIGDITVGVKIGNLLLGDDKEIGDAAKNALIGLVAGGLAATIGVMVYMKLRQVEEDVPLLSIGESIADSRTPPQKEIPLLNGTPEVQQSYGEVQQSYIETEGSMTEKTIPSKKVTFKNAFSYTERGPEGIVELKRVPIVRKGNGKMGYMTLNRPIIENPAQYFPNNISKGILKESTAENLIDRDVYFLENKHQWVYRKKHKSYGKLKFSDLRHSSRRNKEWSNWWMKNSDKFTNKALTERMGERTRFFDPEMYAKTIRRVKDYALNSSGYVSNNSGRIHLYLNENMKPRARVYKLTN